MGRSKLKLDLTAEWIELSFNTLKWRVYLKWEAGNVLFDSSWGTFVKEANLTEGDACVILQTGNALQFKVAVFEANYALKMNTAGNALIIVWWI